jgi:hypothetical protein
MGGQQAQTGTPADRRDEIHIGKKQKFLTVVCNLETGEPLWFGRERKKETLDAFSQEELSRSAMLKLETELESKKPGPRNKVPWAGKKKGEKLSKRPEKTCATAGV